MNILLIHRSCCLRCLFLSNGNDSVNIFNKRLELVGELLYKMRPLVIALADT
jgi:hypothetical protein